MIDLGIVPVIGEQGRYLVRSGGVHARQYLVDLEEGPAGWCGCPHFEYKIALQLTELAECKHLRRARFYQRLQRIATEGRA
jgi:hypothetical protein